MKDYVGNTIKRGQTVLVPNFNFYREYPFFTKCKIKRVNKDSVTMDFNGLTIEDYKKELIIIK